VVQSHLKNLLFRSLQKQKNNKLLLQQEVKLRPHPLIVEKEKMI
jgi:hypothetical protein